RGGQPRPSRGYDLETVVQLTLEEVATGAEKTIEFTRQDTCAECTGTGVAKGKQPSKCGSCGGAGQVQRGGMGGFFQMVSTCPQCRGTGQVITDPCKKCRGKESCRLRFLRVCMKVRASALPVKANRANWVDLEAICIAMYGLQSTRS
ncbi:MAG: zinc finger domain-containing protein, partial [Planctomycetota bacterium]